MDDHVELELLKARLALLDEVASYGPARRLERDLTARKIERLARKVERLERATGG